MSTLEIIFTVSLVLFFFYIVVEIICVATYRRRLKNMVAANLVRDFSAELNEVGNHRHAFFEGYRYLLNSLPEDFFKPKDRLKYNQKIDSLLDLQTTVVQEPPEQSAEHDRA